MYKTKPIIIKLLLIAPVIIAVFLLENCSCGNLDRNELELQEKRKEELREEIENLERVKDVDKTQLESLKKELDRVAIDKAAIEKERDQLAKKLHNRQKREEELKRALSACNLLLKKSREIALEKDFIKKEKEKYLDASKMLTAKILDKDKTIKFIRNKYDNLLEEHKELVKEYKTFITEYKTFLTEMTGEESEP